MTNSTRSVWLLGAYGNGNLGDDMLGDLARLTLESGGTKPKLFAGRFFPFHKDSDHGRRSIITRVHRRDHLLIAGGGLLNDHFGFGFLLHFASIALVLRLKGARYSFVGIGVEGFKTVRGAGLALVAIKLAQSVSVRDSPSQDNVRSIGGRARTIPDLGWLARRHVPPADLNRERDVVVMTIAVEKEEFRSSREEVIRAAVAEVLRETKKNVVLVAMQASSESALDDLTSLNAIKLALNSDRVKVCRPQDYRQLYAILQQACVVSGYRLHAAVLGAVAGSRVVAVSRSHKVREALADLSQCQVVEEKFPMDVESLALGSKVVAACRQPQVTEAQMLILDTYCRQIEQEIASARGGIK